MTDDTSSRRREERALAGGQRGYGNAIVPQVAAAFISTTTPLDAPARP